MPHVCCSPAAHNLGAGMRPGLEFPLRWLRQNGRARPSPELQEFLGMIFRVKYPSVSNGRHSGAGGTSAAELLQSAWLSSAWLRQRVGRGAAERSTCAQRLRRRAKALENLYGHARRILRVSRRSVLSLPEQEERSEQRHGPERSRVPASARSDEGRR